MRATRIDSSRERLRLLSAFGFGALMLFLMAAGNTGGHCLPFEPEAECETAADCTGPAPFDCEGAFVCHGGVCDFLCDENPPPDPDPDRPYEACMSDRDCGAGGYCDTSLCLSCCPGAGPDQACIMACCGRCVYDPVPAPPPYAACTSDADCGRGERCDMSECLSCCPDAGPDEACIALCCGRCVPDDEPPPPPPECESDADCGRGERCEMVCEDMPCACPDGEPCACPAIALCYVVCVRHTDPPPPAPYEACMSDRDCGSGGYCDGSECLSCCPDAGPNEPCIMACCGRCVYDVPPPPEQCSSDADCPAGYTCECLSDPTCPMCDVCYFACVPGHDPPPPPPVQACVSDRDCGPGGRCDTSECLSCCPGAGPGEPCITLCCGKCVYEPAPPEQCRSDDDCPEGYTCECLNDPDCPMCTVCYFACMPVAEPSPCIRTGCSGQVCAAEPVATTCEWRSYYACFDLAECAADEAGVCGWVENDAFRRCMATHGM